MKIREQSIKTLQQEITVSKLISNNTDLHVH